VKLDLIQSFSNLIVLRKYNFLSENIKELITLRWYISIYIRRNNKKPLTILVRGFLIQILG